MGRNTRPIMLIVAALIVAAGGIGIALALRGSSSAAPKVTATVTVTPTAAAPASAATSAPPASPTTTSAAPAPSAPAPTILASAFTVCSDPGGMCGGTMKTKPSMIITSGDSSMFVKVTSWSAWGSPTAYGTGTLEIDDCNPTCVQGTFTGHPATVTLTGLTPYAGGKQAYAEMAITSPPNSMSFHHLLP